MDRRRRAQVLALLAATLVTAIAAFARADGSSQTIPTYSVKLTPNWIHPTYGGVNHNAVWVYGKSPTTPYRSPDSLDTQTRYLLLDPRATDADGRRGHDDWWFVIERMWPSDYPADDHGRWGREVDFHNVAGDAGPPGSGGIGWGFGSGVSALALDWLDGASSPEFSVEPMEPNNHYRLPSVQRNTWQTYVVHWVAGRTDGTTPRPGSLTVWVDGNNTPAIDAQNINTVQRAQGPDGKWYTQRWMVLWEGDYTMDLPVTSRVQFALTRVGSTLQEAIDDRPVSAGTNAGGQYYRGTGVNLGAPEADSTGGRSPGAAKIPTSLISTPAAAPVNTGAPTIGGTAQTGQTLTADNGDWDGDPTGYAYRWQRCNTSGDACTTIDGATDSTYTVTDDDVDATLRVEVEASNDGGSTTATSQPTDTVTDAKPTAPVNTGAPTIGGTAQTGQTLTADNGDWDGDPTGYAYRWQRCNTSGDACTTIDGATDSTYTVTDDDVDATLRVEVEASNDGGSTTATSQPTDTIGGADTSEPDTDEGQSGTDETPPDTEEPKPTAPVNTGAPTIGGTAQTGQTLTADNGDWDGDPTGYAYRWQRCNTSGDACTTIDGATDSTYTVTDDDVDATLRVEVEASNDGGSTTATSQPTDTIGGADTSEPDTDEGQSGTDETPPDTEEPEPDTDETGANADEPKPAAPVNTKAPRIGGTAQTGQTLTADKGSWDGDPSGYAYQWQRCNTGGDDCNAVQGATDKRYAVRADDAGNTLRIQVKATNDGGSTTATSQPTDTIAGTDKPKSEPDKPKPAAPVNTKAPRIGGTAQTGQTLTADKGSWDGDPSGYAYQWQRCNTGGDDCNAVQGATDKRYAVRADDAGNTLRIQVKATNDGGSTTATSQPTDTIARRGGDAPDNSNDTERPSEKPDPSPSKPDDSKSTEDVTAPGPSPQKPDAPKVDTPKVDTPKVDTPKVDTPKPAPGPEPGNPSAGNNKPSPPAETPQVKDVQRDATGMVRWAGRAFDTKHQLRVDLVSRGVDWGDFLRTHPAVVETLNVSYVTWNGRRFFDDRDLASYLGLLGVPWFVWAANHPPASVMLAAQSYR